MNSRERVFAALQFTPVDKAPLEYHPCRRGLFEHGEALRQLFQQNPGDFEDFTDLPIPVPPKDAFDADGRYHEIKQDVWGTKWEYRIFAMTGHPCEYPLADESKIAGYQLPANTFSTPAQKQELAEHVAKVKEYGYCKMGWISIFERMHALRQFEDILMDLYDDSTEINLLADRLVEFQAREIADYLEAGVDGIQFGDDFGTTTSMLLSPERWREFFKPRYRQLMAPIKAAGKQIFFHTCGCSREILPDLKEIGVDAIWPQQTAYDTQDLAALTKELGLATAIHIDRAGVMTSGTPEEVEREVHRTAKAFDIMNGGSWFYVETDNGFPFENIRALLRAISEYRK